MSGGYGFTVEGEPVGDEAVSRGTVGSISFSPALEAHRLVHGDRQAKYGHPKPLYERVGRIWGAILGIPDIPADKVLLMLAGMKVGREAGSEHEDNLTDLAGYAEAIALVRQP